MRLLHFQRQLRAISKPGAFDFLLNLCGIQPPVGFQERRFHKVGADDESRGPKTIGWLPPEKRKLEMHDKKKKGTKKKADDEVSSSGEDQGSEGNSSSEE